MIWKISQVVNNGYDTYSDAVVIAADAEAARRTHPDGDHQWREGVHPDDPARSDWAVEVKAARNPTLPQWLVGDYTWAPIQHVEVTLIGVVTGEAKPGVVCASFHAG